MNVYLFEKNISPLQSQKNGRELEIIIEGCILTAIRESIPTEEIIRAYMDESVEHEEEVVIENIEDPVLEPVKEDDDSDLLEKEKEKENDLPEMVPAIKNMDEEPVTTRLSFNDFDKVLTGEDNVEEVNAPKTIERLEEISTERAMQRKLEEEEDDDLDSIKIDTGADIDLGMLDIFDLNGPSTPSVSNSDDILLNDIVELG
jgi:hypothetical protein